MPRHGNGCLNEEDDQLGRVDAPGWCCGLCSGYSSPSRPASLNHRPQLRQAPIAIRTELPPGRVERMNVMSTTPPQRSHTFERSTRTAYLKSARGTGVMLC